MDDHQFEFLVKIIFLAFLIVFFIAIPALFGVSENLAEVRNGLTI